MQLLLPSLLPAHLHLLIGSAYLSIINESIKQVQLHKIRNDSNFRETPWVNSLEELPRTDQPLELLPPRPGQPGAVAPNRWHKVRCRSWCISAVMRSLRAQLELVSLVALSLNCCQLKLIACITWSWTMYQSFCPGCTKEKELPLTCEL
eukprot:1137947-Pelagomonas_calceolata.AAC.11